MNKIILMGRLTRDPEFRYSQGENQIAVARYNLAVDRRKKREDGISADFFHVVAFDRGAEFVERFLRKGMRVLVIGHVQLGAYTNRDGIQMPFFEVVADEHEFADSKRDTQPESENEETTSPLWNEDDVEELPF